MTCPCLRDYDVQRLQHLACNNHNDENSLDRLNLCNPFRLQVFSTWVRNYGAYRMLKVEPVGGLKKKSLDVSCLFQCIPYHTKPLATLGTLQHLHPWIQ